MTDPTISYDDMRALASAWGELRRCIARDVLDQAAVELESAGNPEAAAELRELTDDIVWFPR